MESAFQSKHTLGKQIQEKGSTSDVKIGVESFRGGGYSRGRNRGIGRNQCGRGRMNLGKGYGDSKKCYSCNKLGHESRNYWYKKETQCFNCKGFGHLTKDYGVRNDQQANVTKDKEGSESMFYASQSSMKDKNRQWLIDSACSNHVTPNKGMFNDIDIKRQNKVKIQNGEFISASGLGTIGVETKKGKKVICEVMHVPQVDRNLLSVGQLIEHRYSLHVES